MASSTTRSSSAKKSSTRKTTAKKATKTTAKKAAKKQSGGAATKSGGSAPRAESRPAASAARVAGQAASELLELTGKAVEGVTGLERTDDGWTIQVEVVEVRRIPDTTDVLALYEITTDKQGSLEGYRRLRRYARGVPGDD